MFENTSIFRLGVYNEYIATGYANNCERGYHREVVAFLNSWSNKHLRWRFGGAYRTDYKIKEKAYIVVLLTISRELESRIKASSSSAWLWKNFNRVLFNSVWNDFVIVFQSDRQM